ncbi:MAG: hypothetical protein GF375_04710 [Candidatus Omnitrophica bacterium]|nr:hypothetical protein [Candidatus Omnitrophota bacterium]MBD3269328.1 hypothetical protein [Candidatus Omnitrophota bacterium]
MKRRRSERKNFDCNAKIFISRESKPLNIRIKDISLSGIRVIIAGRLIKKDTPVNIILNIRDREISCKGKIAWVLTISFGVGNLPLFDAGIEFKDIDKDDFNFFKDFVTNIKENGQNIQ